MTLRSALVVALVLLAPGLCAARRHGRHHAGQALRSHGHHHVHRHGHHGHDHRSNEPGPHEPALFAKRLAAVEDDWRSQVALAKECDDGQVNASKCERLPRSFRESCTAVSGMFVQVNGGNTGQIRHFMELVCGDAAMNDPLRRSQCSSMAGGIVDAKEKSDKDHGSLESVLGAMCDGMWARMVQPEAQSAQEQAKAPVQAAADDDASTQSRAEDASTPSAQQAVSAAAVALAAEQGPASRPSRPKLAAVATHTSVGKAVWVVSDEGSEHDEDQEGGDSGGAAAGKEAGDSEDEEGDEDGQKDDGAADDGKQGDAEGSGKDGDGDEGAGGDEDGDEEGDGNAD